jgi:hypothetical protein
VNEGLASGIEGPAGGNTNSDISTPKSCMKLGGRLSCDGSHYDPTKG